MHHFLTTEALVAERRDALAAEASRRRLASFAGRVRWRSGQPRRRPAR